MTGLSIWALLAASALVQATAPEWRVASFSTNVITYVDETSISIDGGHVGFNLAMRVREHRMSGPAEIRERVEGNCAGGSWKSVRSWPSRENGREVITRDEMEMTVAPESVFGQTLRSACTRIFQSPRIANPDRHAAAYLTANGSPRDRLATATAAEH